MTNTTILKLIELLEKNEKQEIKNILTLELLKEYKDKKSANRLKTTQKYFKEMDDSRPILKTLMIRDNKKFICNGYSLYVFLKDFNGIDSLPTTTENCLDITQILPKGNFRELDNDENLLLHNIKKYIDYVKATRPIENKKDEISIYINNRVFNAKLVLQCTEMLGNLDNLEILSNDDNCSGNIKIQPIQIKNDEVLGMVLPVRIFDEEKFNKIKETTETFIKRIKEGI